VNLAHTGINKIDNGQDSKRFLSLLQIILKKPITILSKNDKYHPENIILKNVIDEFLKH